MAATALLTCLCLILITFTDALSQQGCMKRNAEQCGCPVPGSCHVTLNGLVSYTLSQKSLAYLEAMGWDTVTLEGMNVLLAQNTTNSSTFKEIMPYLVSCALDEGDTWNATLEDGLAAQYIGQFGFAPSLSSTVMSQEEQQWVSGCLLSRVNYFGVHVELSLRNNAEVELDDYQTLTEFSVFEGAFFGTLFSNNTTKYACQGKPRAEALAESPDRQWRVCTDSDNLCQMIVLGSCANYCSNYSLGGGYTTCSVQGQTYTEVVNVFLRSSASTTYSFFFFFCLFILYLIY